MFREERRERGEGITRSFPLVLADCGLWLAGLLVACRAGGLLVGRCLAVCGGRPLPLRAPMRFGRGVRPSSVTCPCCLSRSLPVRFPHPGCGAPTAAYVGFLFPCLARLLVAPGVASHLSSAGLFLSLCYSL